VIVADRGLREGMLLRMIRADRRRGMGRAGRFA
jgi:exopolyphosphatase/pppGpp-phosphohydrolase